MPCSQIFPWLVVLASFAIRAIVYGITYTSGIVYVIVLETFQTGKAGTSWISSIITTVMFAAGPASGRLVKAFGWRIITFVGGVIAGTGLLLASFTSDLFFLTMSYGFVTGFGCGMAYMVAGVAVPAYFRGHRRQKIAVAIASCGTGVGTFAFSPIIQYLYASYGWKNLFIVLAGIALQCSSIGLFYKPIQSISSTETVQEEEKAANWSFVKSAGFYVTHVGFFLTIFGDSVIYGHLGEYAQILGFTTDKGAYLYSVIGISVMIVKLLQGVALDSKRSTSLPIKLATFFFLLGGFATGLLFASHEYWMLLFYAALFGANTAATGGAIVVGILETYFGLENLELTYGMNLAVTGLGNLIGSPIAGFLFETYSSYSPALIMVCVTKVLSSGCFLFVYKFYPEFHYTIRDYDVIFSKKEESLLKDETVLTLDVDEEKCPLIIEKLPKYCEVLPQQADSTSETSQVSS